MPRRVAITGLGAVSPFGVGAEALWDALIEGRTAIAPIRAFDASGFHCCLGAELPDGFSIRDHVPKSYRKATKVMARDIEMAVAAANAAIRDAGLLTKAVLEEGQSPTYPPQRMGCNVGAGFIIAEINELTAALDTARGPAGGFSYEAWGESGMHNLTPLWMLKYLPNMLACHVTILHDAQGPSNTITCSEASGLLSIGESRAVIERGHADACFSGSAESKISPLGLIRAEHAGRIGHTGADVSPGAAVRPYDPTAPGGVLGEGGGIVILESLESARERGARVYAEIAGFGAGQSPSRTADPQTHAIGLTYAIENALRDAGIGPDDIDAILPGAFGAPEPDLEEATALRAVFGQRLRDIPLITITPNIGNTLAGNGGLAACVASMALHRQTLPARIHAGTPPQDLQAGATPHRDAPLRHVLVCTTALAGQNAALVLRRPE
jgi:3-oxoacyl-[acyl-carrier-protein] synthase II